MIIHPSIFGWCYGSGFPKATRIDTQLDKQSGRERIIVGKSNRHSGISSVEAPISDYSRFKSSGNMNTSSQDPFAKAWEHYRYGLQALKPALEPVIVFQKPYDGKPLDSIVKHGSGALNIDATRIRYEDTPNAATNPLYRVQHGYKVKVGSDKNGSSFSIKKDGGEVTANPQGRWPANFYVDKEAAKRLDAQVGVLKSGIPTKGKLPTTQSIYGKYNTRSIVGFGDSGGASRFFFNVQEHIDAADLVFYCAKTSKKERNAGCEGLRRISHSSLEQFAGDGRGRQTEHAPTGNAHPTLKPLSLCQWLATLLLPPAMYTPRRLLVPFSGTSSEMIGALQAGWDRVLGIEQEEEYVIIAKKRISYWVPKK